MAKQCYQIPTSYTLWGAIHNTTVQGIGTMTQPDGKAASSATAPASPASSG